MGLGANHLDRLLPRHEAEKHLNLSWNVRVERSGLFKKQREELSTPASIRDISLDGALVEVTNTSVHEVGDRVAVRFHDLDGHAVICHCRPGDDETLLYGVRFLPDPAFKDAVDTAVGQIRGRAAELANAWQRQN